jgi:hypothetical protein
MKLNMNIVKSFCIATILLISIVFNNTFAQETFEGKLKFKMTSPEGVMDMVYFSKGKKIKVNIAGAVAGENVSMIMTDESIKMLMPGQNMYMEFPVSMMKKMQGAAGGEGETEYTPEDFPKFKTGQTKVINGYKCDQYKFEDDNAVTEVWATTELGNFYFLQNPMGGENGVQSMFNNAGFFPLIILSKNKVNGTDFKMEATEIEKMSLSDNEFAIPAGYNKLDAGMFNTK